MEVLRPDRSFVATCLRFATVYGTSPRMRFDLTVNEFTRDLLVKQELLVFGEQFWRPYIHVRDAAQAIAYVLTTPASVVAGEVFNVGNTQENYRKLDIVDLLRERLPDGVVNFVRRDEDPRDYRVSFEKFVDRVGFKPGRTLAEGIDEVCGLLRSGLIEDPYAPELQELTMTSAPAATCELPRLAARGAGRAAHAAAAGAPRHAFTVDVEDWYQSCLDYDAPITDRVVAQRRPDPRRPRRVRRERRRSSSRDGSRRRFPNLVASLVAQGHEVQSHGYSHRPLYSMDRAELRDELERAKKTVEDAAGTAVTAFRAQDFSILSRNLWALETLADVGFEVDSSIFPMRSRHYGIANWRARAALPRRPRRRAHPRGPGRDLVVLAGSGSRSPAAATSACSRAG